MPEEMTRSKTYTGLVKPVKMFDVSKKKELSNHIAKYKRFLTECIVKKMSNCEKKF